ncbi:hypothetical protein OIU78_029676 [Salix suchowensis]|nr:hypothetical protein OIU78_029676 [Salix suchowensis]
MPWFQRRLTIAEQEQNRLWRQARMTANINLLISKMPEWKLLIISMLLKDISMLLDETYQKLKKDLQAVILHPHYISVFLQ